MTHSAELVLQYGPVGVNTSYEAGSNNIHNMNYLTLKYSIKTVHTQM